MHYEFSTLRIFIASLFFSLLSPSLYAETRLPSNPAVASATAISAAPQRGTLYRVRHKGNTSHLFGTIHIGKAAFFPLEPQVMQALAQSSSLALELNPKDMEPLQRAVKKYAVLADGDNIKSHLSAKHFAKLQQALKTAEIPLQSVATLKPWMIANLLLIRHLQSNGYQLDQGVELHLLALAKTQSKPVRELETADFQMSLFDAMTAEQQEQYLVENITEIENGEALKKTHGLMAAWGSADGKAFDALLREIREEKTTTSEFLRVALLEKRNPAMTTKIEGLLKQDKASFIAVGLLHLLGDQGIPALLRQRGYVVEKIY